MQAQYYRDPARMVEFLESNTFLRDMNGEGGVDEGGGSGREDGGRGLKGLENMIAVAFREDSEFRNSEIEGRGGEEVPEGARWRGR